MFGKSELNNSSKNASVESGDIPASESIETELLHSTTEARQTEIKQSGRADTFEKIGNYLKGDVRIAFALVNYAPTVLDDEIDANGNKVRLWEAKTILNSSFDDSEYNPSVKKSWGEQIAKLGRTLSRLHQEGFDGAQKVLNEVINFWDIEEQNLDRRGQVLTREELNKLNMRIGKSIGMQFLHLITPELDDASKEAVAEAYGSAIKLADNLSDLEEDLKEGFINISQEDIDKHKVNIWSISWLDKQPYIEAELQKIKDAYALSDRILERIIQNNPDTKQALMLFKEVADSWLVQALELESDENLHMDTYDYYSFYNELMENPLPEMQQYFDENNQYLANLVTEGNTAIDVGCGNGRILKFLAPKLKHIIGVDIDSRMVKMAKENVANIENVGLVTQDFVQYTPKEPADLVYASFNLIGSPHFKDEDRSALLLKLISMTKPGGRVVVDFWSDAGLDFATKFYTETGSKLVEIKDGQPYVTDAGGAVRCVKRWSREKIAELAREVADDFEIIDLAGIFYLLDIKVKQKLPDMQS